VNWNRVYCSVFEVSTVFITIRMEFFFTFYFYIWWCFIFEFIWCLHDWSCVIECGRWKMLRVRSWNLV
jgi:hypothetical protein